MIQNYKKKKYLYLNDNSIKNTTVCKTFPFNIIVIIITSLP